MLLAIDTKMDSRTGSMDSRMDTKFRHLAPMPAPPVLPLPFRHRDPGRLPRDPRRDRRPSRAIHVEHVHRAVALLHAVANAIAPGIVEVEAGAGGDPAGGWEASVVGAGGEGEEADEDVCGGHLALTLPANELVVLKK